MSKNLGKDYSDKQEKQIAKMVGGRTQSNSGGTKFGGGDVHTSNILIEAKTLTKPKDTFTIRKEWLDKAREQAFEQNKVWSALAFRFDPDGPDYFVVSKHLFSILVQALEEEI